MSDTPTTTRFELLEQLADTLAAGSAERDHGIAWAVGGRPDLRSLLADDAESEANPVEPDTTLISVYWEPSMAGGCLRRLFTVKLPSGRELLVDDFDVAPQCEVIGVIDRQDEHAHLRAFQAAISGERTSDPLLIGFPDSTTLAYGGVVLVDALAEALRSSPLAAESFDDPEYYWIAGIGGDAKQRHVAALEDELEEDADGERADELQEMLDLAEGSPSWLWALEPDDAERLTELAAEEPPIALYAPPGIPVSFDPTVAAGDPLYQAVALLVAFGEI